MIQTNNYTPLTAPYCAPPCLGESPKDVTEKPSPQTAIRVLPTTPGIEVIEPPCEDLGVESTFGELPIKAREEALPTDPLDRFLSRKLSIREASIAQVVREIQSRIRLRDRLLASMDQDMTRLKEKLYQAAPWGESSPFSVGDARRRAALEGQLSALEVEKRKEETSAWRDVASLKKELRELLCEYEEEKRKLEVIQP